MLRRTALLAHRIAQRSQPSFEQGCPACLALQLSEEASSSNRPFTRGLGFSSVRGYAKPAEVSELDDEEEPPIPISPRVRKLAEEIMHLNLLEVADLTDLLQKRLNITPGFAGMPMLPGPMPGAAAPAAVAAAVPEEKEPEKTEFDVKLDGFDAASKIKVIKEIRSVTELGLKEAKELVEKSPVVVKAGLKKEEAEALQKKLEAVGGKVSLE